MPPTEELLTLADIPEDPDISAVTIAIQRYIHFASRQQQGETEYGRVDAFARGLGLNMMKLSGDLRTSIGAAMRGAIEASPSDVSTACKKAVETLLAKKNADQSQGN